MKYHPYFLKSVLLALLLTVVISCDQEKKKKFTVADVPDPKQTGGGYVSNPDHLISDQAVTELNEKLSALDHAGKVQVAVVVIHSIGENETRDFAHQLFNYWKIGDKEKNNGLLILMVEDARKLEFETGYGIEADMPDITCYRIQQEYMIPRIKEHNYDAAFTDGILSVASLFNNGNYAYDMLPDVPAPDHSLLPDNNVVDPVAVDLPAVTVAADSAVAEADNSVAYAQRQQFADTPTNNNSSTYIGDFSFIGVILWLIISAILMRVFFGKIVRQNKGANAEPVTISGYTNEFFRPGWVGLLLLHGGAFACIYYIAFQRHTDIGFVKMFVLYYLVWVVFIHVAVLIIMARSAALLRGKDRHEKWLQLEVLRRDFGRAGYVFPAPYLWLYLGWLKIRLNHLRNDPYDCHHCLKPMHKLDEKADNKFLDKKQVIEEELQSVDYDVWGCDTCDSKTILNYTNMRSSLAQCPSCAHMTYKNNGMVTKMPATYASAGWGVTKYACAACGFKHEYRYTIAKLVESSSSSSSSSGSSYSSSSSSSSSSWGGGSSGGGGASSSW
ncbi:TPM domain-containing protein [Chitinophaga hostae]|uniref:TPM domain-containing protein n=1 Tax=Chitinophaga hostae TaxID=2831022 RepID=A0ABS5J8U1_9BACT|nr:TPM domain-containing protein [Chitinophaga hostae]MBS0031643.1 TPM domain-containing protein [Chitinophaga hostae]